MAGLVVKAHQLVGAECERCIGQAIVVTEFDLVHFRSKNLYDRSDLPRSSPFSGTNLAFTIQNN